MADPSDPDSVPTFVVATQALHADGPPTLFRSYRCTGYNANKCAIWQAARATSAAPTFFKPIEIDVPPQGSFLGDGGLTHNNPAELALSEAQRIWSTVKHFCLVSVGTGLLKSAKLVDVRESAAAKVSSTASQTMVQGSKGIPVEESASSASLALRKIREICVLLATSSESVHQRILNLSHSHELEKRFSYHRFNVEGDVYGIELQEWKKTLVIDEYTAAYMEVERESELNQCVQDLMNPPPIKRKSVFWSFI